ncbi:MAG: hypothetical protein KatS3mg014_2543 [Actinomycetota bacterium]|nr:MAG: hypothetical protein KatS3mg014_2462 [Actinomycetota bacterium]GIV00928.1 MAG: hypothetical protein KatS3mg014_2543 [Actinomycetota bacterium]
MGVGLHATAQGLLTAVVAVLATPPTRAYVWVGSPPADCAQVVVALADVARTVPDQAGVAWHDLLRSASMDVVLDYCAPTARAQGQSPPAAELGALAQRVMDDIDAVLPVLHRICGRSALTNLSAATSGGILRVTIGVQVQW